VWFSDVIPVTLRQSGCGNNSSGVTLHQGGTSSDGGIGLHQVIRNSNIVVGLQESGPSIDLHHSVIGSSDVIVRLHEDGSSRDIGSTQSDVPLGSTSPPLNTPMASPPSISNLLELSLPASVGDDLALPTDSETGLLDVPIQDSSATAHPSFVGKSSASLISAVILYIVSPRVIAGNRLEVGIQTCTCDCFKCFFKFCKIVCGSGKCIKRTFNS
jgi:hypothetical protein